MALGLKEVALGLTLALAPTQATAEEKPKPDTETVEKCEGIAKEARGRAQAFVNLFEGRSGSFERWPKEEEDRAREECLEEAETE